MPERLQQLQIELSGLCNKRCPYCTSSKRTTGRQLMDTTLALQLIGEANQMHVPLVTFHTMGEPLLHPEATYILWWADEMGLTTRVSTNCVLLEMQRAVVLAKLSRLQLIMAMHPDRTEDDLHNAIDYLKNGYRNRSVQAVFVCQQGREHDADAFYADFEPFTIDPRFEMVFKQPQTWPNAEPQYGFVPRHLMGKRGCIVEDVQTPISLGKSCTMPTHLMNVLADGTVTPCCVGMDDWGLGKVGNGRTIREAWESPEFEAVREKWRQADDSVPCGYCLKRTDA